MTDDWLWSLRRWRERFLWAIGPLRCPAVGGIDARCERLRWHPGLHAEGLGTCVEMRWPDPPRRDARRDLAKTRACAALEERGHRVRRCVGAERFFSLRALGFAWSVGLRLWTPAPSGPCDATVIVSERSLRVVAISVPSVHLLGNGRWSPPPTLGFLLLLVALWLVSLAPRAVLCLADAVARARPRWPKRSDG